MSIADLLAAVTIRLAVRFLGRFDQSAVRGKVLLTGKAGDILNLIEHHQAQDPAHAWNTFE